VSGKWRAAPPNAPSTAMSGLYRLKGTTGDPCWREAASHAPSRTVNVSANAKVSARIFRAETNIWNVPYPNGGIDHATAQQPPASRNVQTVPKESPDETPVSTHVSNCDTLSHAGGQGRPRTSLTALDRVRIPNTASLAARGASSPSITHT
jgi:hypothetical protein